MQGAGSRGIHQSWLNGMDMKSKIENYRDLKVWQLGMEITRQVYEATKCFPKDEQFDLTSQMRRAASSIPANLAEGHSRSSTKDYLRFTSIALGSLSELATFLELSGQMGIGSVEKLRAIYEMTLEERKMLRGLQKALRKRLNVVQPDR